MNAGVPRYCWAEEHDFGRQMNNPIPVSRRDAVERLNAERIGPADSGDHAAEAPAAAERAPRAARIRMILFLALASWALVALTAWLLGAF
jgi:hypothetical protein